MRMYIFSHNLSLNIHANCFINEIIYVYVNIKKIFVLIYIYSKILNLVPVEAMLH